MPLRLAINALATRPGGALSVLIGLLQNWRQTQSDFRVTVMASVPETLAALRQGDLGIRLEPCVVKAGPWRRSLWLATRLRRWLLAQQADVLLTNNHYVERCGRPQVVHHHNLWRFLTPELGVVPSRGISNRLRDRQARRALELATANVFVSELLRRQAERLVPRSTARNHVIPNCPNVDEPVASELVKTSGVMPRLFTMQSANLHKDNATLMHTLAHLAQRQPEVAWRLRVAGSAGRSAWEPVRQLADHLGVADRVDWLGFVSGQQLQCELEQALCMVATSRLESSGLTLLEAMNVGCPVVASRIPAFVEYGANAVAFAEPGHSEEFAARIRELRERPELRTELIQAGNQRINRYRWVEWAPRMAEIIRLAAGGHPI